MNRQDFPILKEQVNGHALVYLDNAATSQKPQEVIDAISYAYTTFNANIHRGVHSLSRQATLHHEEARERVSKLLNAKSANEIVFTKGTTDSINMLARSFGESFLHEGDEIVISAMEHHSNIVPWQMIAAKTGARLRVVRLTPDLTFDIDAYCDLLNEKTKMVAVAQVSNVLGVENDVKTIIRRAHEAGAVVMVDAAQSVPHMKIDVQDMDCDFLVFSAHKMYGPTGVGVLYGKENLLNQLPPAEGGGEMIEHVSFEKTTYNVLPYKFEAGTPNFIGSYAFSKAIDYVDKIGWEQLTQEEDRLLRLIEEGLIDLGAVVYAKGQEKRGVLSFNFPGIHPYDLGVLLDQQGVAIRTGHHCAEPLINLLGVPGTCRVSVGLYNDENDVKVFLKATQVAKLMLS